MSKCIGCGIKLQTTDPNGAGYVKEIVLIENGDDVYCKRCHDVIHHNKKYDVENDIEGYYSKIKNIKNTNSLVLLLVDIFDINNGFIPKLSEYIGKNEVLVLVNKTDIIPRSMKLKNIEEYIRGVAKKQNLNFVGVMMISAKNPKDCEKVVEKIRKLKYRYKNKRRTGFDDCYVMGCASVGKSTFINSVIGKYLGGKNFITTSEQYHTTVDIIKIPLDQTSYIIDTPGIVNDKSFGNYLNYESMKDLKVNTYIKPKTYQLKSDQTMFIGGLCKLEFCEGENISASFYVGNDLYIHRTKTIKADELWTLQKHKLLVPPYTEEESNKLSDLTQYEILVESKEKSKDLLIPNVGFVHLSGDNLKVKLYIDKKIRVNIEDSFL